MATRCSARAARLLDRTHQSRRQRLLRPFVAPARFSRSARDRSISACSFASVLSKSASLSRAWTCSRSSSSRSSPVAPAAALLRARISARTLLISRFTSASSREPSSVLALASGVAFYVRRAEAARQPQRLRARVRTDSVRVTLLSARLSRCGAGNAAQAPTRGFLHFLRACAQPWSATRQGKRTQSAWLRGTKRYAERAWCACVRVIASQGSPRSHKGPKSKSLVAGAAAGRTDGATRRFTPRSQRSDARSWAQTSLQPVAENKRTAKNTCLVEPKAAVVSTGASVAPCSLPRRGARQNRFVLGLCAPHGAPATSPTRARAARCEAHRRGRPACVQTLPAPRRRKGGCSRSTQSAPTGTTRTCRETRHGELEAL